MWNGIPMEKFWPSRGIRQGDPISSYIFVLCIERLAHSILSHDNNWQPMKLSRSGPPLYLFFADDLLLFFRANKFSCAVVNKILQDFCDVSGQAVNKQKSVVFFS